MPSVLPHHQLNTQTPATNKLNLHRKTTTTTTTKTKPREFNIYIDNKSSPSSTTCSPETKYPTYSNRKEQHKPLEDKTNTVRKKLSRVTIHDQYHSPTNHKSSKLPQSILKSNSQQQLLLTPHPKKTIRIKKSPSSTQFTASKNDPLLKRLLYRTPATSKRAPRPPPIDPLSNDPEDDDEYADVSLDHSFNHLDFDLNQENIPDVEYGPPSAIIEPIESLIDDDEEEEENEMANFFKSLKQSPMNYLISDDAGLTYDASMDNLATSVEEIIKSDGSKEKWSYEPRCEMTNYAVDDLLDQFLIPSSGSGLQPNKLGRVQSKKQPVVVPPSSRTSRLTSTRPNLSTKPPPTRVSSRTKAHLPAPPLSTRQSSRNLAKVSTQTPTAILPTLLTQYHQLVQSLIHDHHSNLNSDLDLLETSPPLIDHDLDSFQFHLVV